MRTQEYSLFDVIEVIGGGTPKTNIKDYWQGDIPWLTVKDFNNDSKYVFSTEKTITNKGLINSSTKILNKNDIILSSRGTVGQIAMLAVPMAFNQSCYGIRGKNIIIQDFLYYFLKNNINTLKANSHGSVFSTITIDTFKNIKINLPNLNVQKTITHILSCLDDKILINKRINDNLEQQAQIFYVDTFVKKIKYTWKKGILSDIGTIVGGSTPSKSNPHYYTKNGIAWITPKDLSTNKSKFIYRGENDISELGLKNSSTIIMPKGTVLFSSRAPIGYIAIAANEVTTNQGFKSVIPNSNIGTEFIYYFLKNNIDLIENMSSGSTFKEISGSNMKKVPVIIPDTETLIHFKKLCLPLFEQQKILEKQNFSLSILRDKLLTKLISGEIDISRLNI